MAEGTLQILGLGISAAPLEYTASGDQSLDLVAVNADFDGSAAGVNFQPVVEIISTAGHVMARGVGPTIAAGDSASVTFAPFLKPATTTGSGITEITSTGATVTVTNPFGPVTNLETSGGGYTPPTAQENFESATTTYGAGVSANIAFTHFGGSNLTSLATPAFPKIVTAGIYALSGSVRSLDPVAAGELVTITLAVNGTGSGFPFDNSFTGPTGGQAAGMGFAAVSYFAANSGFQLGIFNGDSISHDFVIYDAALQRIT